MAQNYSVIANTTPLSSSLQTLLDRDDAAASNFSGTAFPSANLLLGMLCYRTDQLKLYQLTNLTGPVWTLIYDLSSGTMTAPLAAGVPWSGVTGEPTTVAGYGITDAMKKTGDSATGKINFVASAAGAASIGLPHGTAPSAPVDGDVWTTSTGFFARVSSATYQVSFLNAAETYTAKKTFPAGSTSFASFNVPAGAAPTTPVNGDVWATTTQLVYRMNGVSKNVAFWDANSLMPVANGGTGASTAAGAKANLGIVDVPVGSVMPFAGTSEPSGWFFCDGRLLAVATYSALFAAIGFTYGGDGSTTFALPDLRGRVPAGRDNMGTTGVASRMTAGGSGVTGTTLGAAGGAETHTLSIAQMPLHGHPMRIAMISDSTPRTDMSGGMMIRTNSATSYGPYTGAVSDAAGQQVGGQGGNAAHNNVQPTIVLNYIIKNS